MKYIEKSVPSLSLSWSAVAIKKIKPYLPPPPFPHLSLSPPKTPDPKIEKEKTKSPQIHNLPNQKKLPSFGPKITMKMRNKGKVHPSPSSSSSSEDALSVLKLLPVAILAMVSVLSLEDQEVLAYMITRSLKPTSPSSSIEEKSKTNNPKKSSSVCPAGRAHPHSNKTPLFDCDCFDCYTRFWFRWDSSPNRELIGHAIEAFEENLNLGEQSKKGKNRKKDKMGRRGLGKRLDFSEMEVGPGSPEVEETSSLDGQFSIENEIALRSPLGEESSAYSGGDSGPVVDVIESPETAMDAGGGGASTAAAADNHKGLARKVLPDVLGLFNSRLWNLWRPNV